MEAQASDSSATFDASGRKMIWAAMIPAVSMTFIDQTIVSIGVPEIQKDLALSSTGIQWVISGFLVSYAATIAFAGRIGDIYGHRRIVVLGVIVFALCSTLCGLTPDTSIAEPWLIFFRVLQGVGAALVFPSALTLVINTYPIEKRGWAIATFFIIAGLFTAVGPIAGGYLTEWTWRAIFWINIPVAILALILTARAHPVDHPQPAPIDFRGLALLAGGMGLSVLGFQQASTWGWDSPATLGSIAIGVALLVAFVRVERRTENPLIRVRLFQAHAVSIDMLLLALVSSVFVPLFFFASEYSQLALGDSVGNAGLYLAILFGGFAFGSHQGGTLVDKVGFRKPALIGGALGAAGFYFWAQNATDLSVNSQWWAMVMAGAGIGFVLSPVNTDALNRLPAAVRGQAVGVLMTARNFGSAIGLAVMGTILTSRMYDRLDSYFAHIGLSSADQETLNRSFSASGGGDSNLPGVAGHKAAAIYQHVQVDFAHATQVVFYIMAGVMAAVFVLSFVLLRDDVTGEQAELAQAESGA